MRGNIWGSLLGQYRKDNKLIKKEVAAQLELSREYYSKLENGKVEPSGKVINRICNVTGAVIIFPSKKNKEKNICGICSLLTEDKKEILKELILKLLRDGFNN